MSAVFISSNKRSQHLLNFEAFTGAVLIRGWRLFQSKGNKSYQILKLCRSLFQIENEAKNVTFN